MPARPLSWLVLIAGPLALCGCGGSAPPPSPGPGPGPVVQPSPTTEPKKKTESSARVSLSLTELLKQSRADLAKLCDESLAQAQVQEKNRLLHNRPFALYPLDHLPIVLPVWRQAAFSAQVGFSLPPYFEAGKKDRHLALHLARWGDDEAARKLVDAEDAATLQQIETLKLERSYPLEWTRLAALRLHDATWRLATGEVEGLDELGRLHKELHDLLGPKARDGLLGRDLLGRGRGVISAVIAKAAGANKNELLTRARAVLEAGGKIQPVGISLEQLDVAGSFGTSPKNQVVVAASPLRVLDLLSLPFAEARVMHLLGLLDAKNRLGQILILYQPNLESGEIAAETLSPYQTPAASDGSMEEFYLLGPNREMKARVRPVPDHVVLGATVVVEVSKGLERLALPRDLGTLHLSRTFESNRRRFVPQQYDTEIHVTDIAALKQLQLPPLPFSLASATLVREARFDLLRRVEFQFKRPDGKLPIGEALAALGEKLGPLGELHVLPDKTVAFVWRDEKTWWNLGIPPLRDDPPLLAVGYSSKEPTDKTLAQLVQQAQAFERQERQERLKTGKPWSVLPRELEKVKLGQPRAEAKEMLTGLEPQFQRDEGSDIVVTLAGPAAAMPYQPREIVVRCDKNDKVAEVRVRYASGTDLKNGGVAVLLKELKKKYGEVAVPRESQKPEPSTPAQPILYRWYDDATVLQMLVSSGGIELRLRDRPPDQEKGPSLPPLQVLPRGPDKCRLGAFKLELFKLWDITQPQRVGDAFQITPKAGPHDVLLVWFDQENRVNKILARHGPQPRPSDATAAGKAVLDTWGQHMRNFGWPWEQTSDKGVLHRCAAADDVTRISVFWQQQGSEPIRVWTQWEPLNLPEPKE